MFILVVIVLSLSFTRLIHSSSYPYYSIIIITAKIAHKAQLTFTTPAIDSTVGATLSTVPVVDAVGTAVQLDPHAYPVGQHPPPTVSAQLNQPLAHPFGPLSSLPSAVVVGSAATMVWPLLTIVVDGRAGHEVVSQSRPVWQHPPW